MIQNKVLAELSTFHIGGPARYYCEVKDLEALRQALSFCRSRRLSYYILGKGSNSLFDDRGFDGCVIHNKIDFLREIEPGIFYCGAGYSFSRLGRTTARNGWTGLEFASGIPASVGGAIYMNAGANGKETADTLESVEFLSPNHSLQTLPRSQLTFSYRSSSFQKMPGCIVAATFHLQPCRQARAEQQNILAYRQATQPLKEWSAGCAFRNPKGNSAGALIEKCGLKGLSVGGAEVSPTHANFIVNKGNATAADVMALMDLIKRRVQEKTGNILEAELVRVPYTQPLETLE